MDVLNNIEIIVLVSIRSIELTARTKTFHFSIINDKSFLAVQMIPVISGCSSD